MTEIGVVTETSGNRITVSCGSAGCASCAAAGSCSGSLGRAAGTPGTSLDAAADQPSGLRREFCALNSCGLSLAPGDTVEVSFPGGKTALSFLRVIVMPIALFVAAYLAAETAFPALSEGVRALAGFAGLALGVGCSLLFRRPGADLPEVTRKL